MEAVIRSVGGGGVVDNNIEDIKCVPIGSLIRSEN
jgi:hypothetical protein